MTKRETKPEIESTYLTCLVQNIFGNPSLEIVDWKIERISGGLDISSTVYRLTGRALINDQPKTWSMILKTIELMDEFSDPNSYRYLRREIQAYQSGVLYKLPGQVTAPEYYDILEKPDGVFWILMEDIEDEFIYPWSLEEYKKAAYHLGLFNGAYLAGGSLPQEGWLCEDWLLKYLNEAAPMIEFIKQHPNHPAVNSLLPGINKSMSLALWEESPKLLNILDDLPQTFCHQDAITLNLFYRNGQLIVIDWVFAGIAPIGAELAALVGMAAILSGFPSSRYQELDQACFESYLQGLVETGSEIDPRQVRLGFVITMVLRYVLGGTIGGVLPELLGGDLQWLSEGFGVSEEEVGRTESGVVDYYTSITMEALRSLGLGFTVRFIVRTAAIAIRLKIKSLAGS